MAVVQGPGILYHEKAIRVIMFPVMIVSEREITNDARRDVFQSPIHECVFDTGSGLVSEVTKRGMFGLSNSVEKFGVHKMREVDSPGFEPGASSLRRKRSTADLRARTLFEPCSTLVASVSPDYASRIPAAPATSPTNSPVKCATSATPGRPVSTVTTSAATA